MNHEGSVQALFDLSGRVAMVTGATGHLGTAMAAALAEAGASVVVTSRDLDRGQRLADTLPTVGNASHHAAELDYFSAESITTCMADVLEQVGRIDVLVNNGYERVAADWTDISDEQFTRQLANATGCFLLAREIHDHAVQRGGGASIVMIGSMYGVVGSYPDAYAGIGMASPVAYHALKGGILSMTRHLAVYWAKDGVRVNCLSPGPFPAAGVNPEMIRRLETRSPMGRMGKPEELKGAIVFLAGDASSYMTGQNLIVDGGWMAW